MCGALSCRCRTYQHTNATGTPSSEVPTKNHSKLEYSIRNPEAPASKLPGSAHSEVSSAYWLAACSVEVSVDM